MTKAYADFPSVCYSDPEAVMSTVAVAFYARVSSEQQAQAQTIASQVRRKMNCCSRCRV